MLAFISLTCQKLTNSTNKNDRFFSEPCELLAR